MSTRPTSPMPWCCETAGKQRAMCDGWGPAGWHWPGCGVALARLCATGGGLQAYACSARNQHRTSMRAATDNAQRAADTIRVSGRHATAQASSEPRLMAAARPLRFFACVVDYVVSHIPRGRLRRLPPVCGQWSPSAHRSVRGTCLQTRRSALGRTREHTPESRGWRKRRSGCGCP